MGTDVPSKEPTGKIHKAKKQKNEHPGLNKGVNVIEEQITTNTAEPSRIEKEEAEHTRVDKVHSGAAKVVIDVPSNDTTDKKHKQKKPKKGHY